MIGNDVWSTTRALRRRYNRYWALDHIARTFLRRESSWTRKRLGVYEQLRQTMRDAGEGRRPIDVCPNLEPDAFHRNYLDTDTPVILRAAGVDWPAAAWTPELLGERYASTQVRLLRAAPNEPKGQPGEGRDATYAEIAKSMQDGGTLYARFSGIMHQHPELIDDVDLAWFRAMRRDVNDFENWGFFMGGADTATGLHSSIAPNLFYQISGYKRWYIYPAWTAPFFAPAVKCSPYFYSEVDVSDPQNWPIAAASPGWIADLEPGDVLYVPAFAWHQVHNSTATIAVGYRWMSPRLGFRTSRLQTLLAATCSNPPVWKAKGHRDLPALLDAIDY